MSGEGVWATNPHTLMQEQLQELVNQNGVMGLVDLATTLHHTYQPLLAISQLSPTLHLGVIDKVFCLVELFFVPICIILCSLAHRWPNYQELSISVL